MGATTAGLGTVIEVLCGFPHLAEIQELGGACVYHLIDAANYKSSTNIPVNGIIGHNFHTAFPIDEKIATIIDC